MRQLDATTSQFTEQLDALLAWDLSVDSAIDTQVSDIIKRVRTHGDEELLALTRQFDRVDAAELSELEIGQDELASAWAALHSDAQQALQTAADRIRRFHERQREESWSYVDELGCELGQKIQPLDRVGVYVPGGRAAYPSSVLMTLIPAKVGGGERGRGRLTDTRRRAQRHGACCPSPRRSRSCFCRLAGPRPWLHWHMARKAYRGSIKS
jgi:histidinol dehydrogenase